MSKFIKHTFIAVSILFTIFGCSKNSTDPNNSTDPGGQEFLQLEDFAYLDYEEYVVFNHNFRENFYVGYEPALNWEQSFGEPFTDVNGNGVYDEGIDIFIMSSDPSINQDIDRNSTYTGPGETWVPGMPFDDIDGDGECDADNQDCYSYEPGKPYCDLNLNGKRDSLLNTQFFVCYPMLVRYNDSTVIKLVRTQYAFQFVSDSNVVYDMAYSPEGETTLYENSFVFISRMFEIHGKIYGSDFVIPVIKTGPIKTGNYPDTGVFKTPYWFDVFGEYHSLSYEYSFIKHVIPDTSISVNGKSYENALVIRMDNFKFVENGNPSNLYFELYLSPDDGILGYKFSCTIKDNKTESFEAYFNLRYTENPGTMIQ